MRQQQSLLSWNYTMLQKATLKKLTENDMKFVVMIFFAFHQVLSSMQSSTLLLNAADNNVRKCYL